MNVFPHTNLTLARLASETLEPLKHLIFEIFIYCFLRLFIRTSMTFSPRDFLITPYVPLLQFVGNWIQQTICALVCSLIPEQTLYLVAMEPA